MSNEALIEKEVEAQKAYDLVQSLKKAEKPTPELAPPYMDNPVIHAAGNEKIEVPDKCRCKTCPNAFWLRQRNGERLQCICTVTNTKTFWSPRSLPADEDAWVTACEGCEDENLKEIADYTAKERGQEGLSCSSCKNAMWYIENNLLICYCKFIHRRVYDNTTQDMYILDCNGVNPPIEIGSGEDEAEAPADSPETDNPAVEIEEPAEEPPEPES